MNKESFTLDETTPLWSRSGTPAKVIIDVTADDRFNLLARRKRWLAHPIPDVGHSDSLDDRQAAVRRHLRRREVQLRWWGLKISFEERMQAIGPFLSGVSQAGKTSSLALLNQVQLPAKYVSNWNGKSGNYAIAGIIMDTNRPVRPTESGGSLEYRFRSIQEGREMLHSHFEEWNKDHTTDLVAATRYAGRSYFLSLADVRRSLQAQQPIIYPWQREFAIAMNFVFPVSTVIELLPEWGMNLIVYLKERTRQKKREGSHGWICRAVADLVKYLYDDEDNEERVRWDRIERDEAKMPGRYPRPRTGQKRTDYHWRLLYAVASILETFREPLEFPALPMVDLIRVMPFGDSDKKIQIFDNEVATELAEHSLLINGCTDSRLRELPAYEDLEGMKARLIDYLWEVNQDLDRHPWSPIHRFDYTTNPARWTTRYGLTTDEEWLKDNPNADGPYNYAYAYLGAAGVVGPW